MVAAAWGELILPFLGDGDNHFWLGIKFMEAL